MDQSPGPFDTAGTVQHLPIAAGAHAVLAKPFSNDQLLAAVNALFDGRTSVHG